MKLSQVIALWMRNTFGILMCMEICDGAGVGICDGAPSTCFSFYIFPVILKNISKCHLLKILPTKCE